MSVRRNSRVKSDRLLWSRCRCLSRAAEHSRTEQPPAGTKNSLFSVLLELLNQSRSEEAVRFCRECLSVCCELSLCHLIKHGHTHGSMGTNRLGRCLRLHQRQHTVHDGTTIDWGESKENLCSSATHSFSWEERISLCSSFHSIACKFWIFFTSSWKLLSQAYFHSL